MPSCHNIFIFCGKLVRGELFLPSQLFNACTENTVRENTVHNSGSYCFFGTCTPFRSRARTEKSNIRTQQRPQQSNTLSKLTKQKFVVTLSNLNMDCASSRIQSFRDRIVSHRMIVTSHFFSCKQYDCYTSNK